METIKQYKVLNKIFNSEQEAFRYEESIRSDLNLRARNLKVFYWNMLGYPGEKTTIDLINHFCNYHKFDFGKWKGSYIGEIMMIFPSYIRWCLENISSFKLNAYEEALWNTSWKYSLGGISYNLTHDDETHIFGDVPDYELIKWEKKELK